ncbi:MAG: pentapeptide repeat-containing protein [Flavipsychrobacter sp.]
MSKKLNDSVMNTNMIGIKIAQARKKANMSQANLAQLLFISPQAVGKWERGESIPDIITLNRLSEILGVDLNYFSERSQSSDNETISNADNNIAGNGEQHEEAVTASRSQIRQLQVNLNAIDLQGSNFAGVSLHNGRFKTTSLRGANFADADLTGSSFETCNAQEANFDGANLTDCNFSITDLTDANFWKTTLVRTTLEISGQGAKFTDVNLVDVNLNKIDLRKTVFEHCSFNGVDFNYCDLRDMCFDGQTFIGVKFNKSALNNVSFKGATLKNVSFILPFSVTNKSYRMMQTICFDGAMMDMPTYAALKGLQAIDLSKVTII